MSEYEQQPRPETRLQTGCIVDNPDNVCFSYEPIRCKKKYAHCGCMRRDIFRGVKTLQGELAK